MKYVKCELERKFLEMNTHFKAPKLYFWDTSLCAYLSMWLSPETLMNGTASGYYYMQKR